MHQQFEPSDSTDGILQLSAELSNSASVASKEFLFLLRPGKSITLTSTKMDCPKSLVIRRHDQFTLAYSVQVPLGESPGRQTGREQEVKYVEVVLDRNEALYFRDEFGAVTPCELALRLVALVST